MTGEREERLRLAFAEAAAASTAADGEPGGDRSAPGDAVLDLKRCYELLFTDDEREHLAYEYFLEDWGAYRERAPEGEALRPPEGMTVAVALDFLKEMQ